IEKVDKLTVKLHLDRPNAHLLFALYDYPSMIAPDQHHPPPAPPLPALRQYAPVHPLLGHHSQPP
ncbi:MAG: hypothetical protein V3S37_04325, partial [Dehalococcoidia bacterium]